MVIREGEIKYISFWNITRVIFAASQGVYEMVTHVLSPGTMPQWEHLLLQGLPARLALDYPPPLAFFYADFGPGSTGEYNFVLNSTENSSQPFVNSLVSAYIHNYIQYTTCGLMRTMTSEPSTDRVNCLKLRSGSLPVSSRIVYIAFL